MKRGDRLVVINEHDEYFGQAGVLDGLRQDGYLEVKLDTTGWIVRFWPHDVELEGKVKKK